MTEAPEQFGLSSIGQISVNVHDIKKAIAFYRDILGMKFLFEAGGHMAFFDCGARSTWQHRADPRGQLGPR